MAGKPPRCPAHCCPLLWLGRPPGRAQILLWCQTRLLSGRCSPCNDPEGYFSRCFPGGALVLPQTSRLGVMTAPQACMHVGFWGFLHSLGTEGLGSPSQRPRGTCWVTPHVTSGLQSVSSFKTMRVGLLAKNQPGRERNHVQIVLLLKTDSTVTSEYSQYSAL